MHDLGLFLKTCLRIQLDEDYLFLLTTQNGIGQFKKNSKWFRGYVNLLHPFLCFGHSRGRHQNLKDLIEHAQNEFFEQHKRF